MNKKIDIMNNREGETWTIVNGKTQRVEEKKVTGPVVTSAIKEIIKPKKIQKEEIKWKKKSKKSKKE